MFKSVKPSSSAEVLPYILEDTDSFHGPTGWYIDTGEARDAVFQFQIGTKLEGDAQSLRKGTSGILQYRHALDLSGTVLSRLTLMPGRLDIRNGQIVIDGVTGRAEVDAFKDRLEFDNTTGSLALHLAAAGVFAQLQGQVMSELPVSPVEPQNQ